MSFERIVRLLKEALSLTEIRPSRGATLLGRTLVVSMLRLSKRALFSITTAGASPPRLSASKLGFPTSRIAADALAVIEAVSKLGEFSMVIAAVTPATLASVREVEYTAIEGAVSLSSAPLAAVIASVSSLLSRFPG